MGSGPMSGPPGAGGGMMGQPVNESLQISVPNSAVGAIIGAGGANIKQIMRDSGAFVNVSNTAVSATRKYIYNYN